MRILKNISLVLSVALLISSPLGCSSRGTAKPLATTDYGWKLKTLDGKDFDIANTKGKVVFINIWATWCPPCRKEMPSLQKLYDQTKDKVDFFFISDEKGTDVADFLNKTSYDFPVFLSHPEFPGIFKTDSVPTTFILNPEGQIVFRHEGKMDWNTPDVLAFLNRLSR